MGALGLESSCEAHPAPSVGDWEGPTGRHCALASVPWSQAGLRGQNWSQLLWTHFCHFFF